MKCGLRMPFGLFCAQEYNHRGMYVPDAEEARRVLSQPAPALCGVVSNSGRDGEPLACGFTRGHSGAHAWATLPTFVSRRCEKCGTAKTLKVIAVTDSNLPWHDGRSEREICPSCPAKDQLPWAQRFEPAT